MSEEATMSWFLPPEDEIHLRGWMERANLVKHGRLTYQFHKYEAALMHVRERRIAVDVGAHVGLWTYPMSFDFETVHAFEPMPRFRYLWELNLMDRPNAVMHPYALGPTACEAAVMRASHMNVTTLTRGVAGAIPVDMIALDAMHLEHVDFVKIDCEGFELFVLQGALGTLRRCRPVVIVEQKEGIGTWERYGVAPRAAVEFLIDLGYTLQAELAGDYVLSYDEKKARAAW